MDERENQPGFGTGLMIGTVVGLIFGMLYAPHSGRETRQIIKMKKDEAEQLVVEAKERAKKIIDEAKSKVAEEKST
jgi:gas vesicle protein